MPQLPTTDQDKKALAERRKGENENTLLDQVVFRVTDKKG